MLVFTLMSIAVYIRGAVRLVFFVKTLFTRLLHPIIVVTTAGIVQGPKIPCYILGRGKGGGVAGSTGCRRQVQATGNTHQADRELAKWTVQNGPQSAGTDGWFCLWF